MRPGVVRRAAGGQGLNPALRRAWKAIGALEDVAAGEDVFAEPGEPAYCVNAKQLCNPVSDDELAIRLTRKVVSAHRPRLKADDRVVLRGSSDWIGVRVAKPADVALAVELAELAAAVYRPTDGSSCKPPPTGADLERRRRFH